jgi:hypothetical protein
MKDNSFLFSVQHLYRKPSAFVLAGLILVVLSSCVRPAAAFAQNKKQKGPRALGVVAWSGDSATPDPATSVLEPVDIYVEGRFYDASIYEAQPAPLAVDSGVVYDVLQSGNPVGTFTVGMARDESGTWFGLGRYEPKGAAEAKVAKAAPAPATTPAPADDRPHLRRGAPPPAPPKEQTDAVLSNIDRDPERPTLRRHPPAEEKKPGFAAEPLKVPPTHMLPAISTESGPEYRPFAFHAKAGELDQMRAAMEKLARAEFDKDQKPQSAPASALSPTTRRQTRSRQAASTSPMQLENPKFGVYDVNTDNAPIVVYSATAVRGDVKKYVTVAAWEEIDQSLRKVFAQITDDRHLDVYPRLEVIDAVDAKGNGRGELLFRAFGDQGSRFILYHPGPDSLEILFDSARGES